MKSAEGKIGRAFVLRLEDGDRIPDCIEQFAKDKCINGALCALVGGIGGGTLVVGPADGEASPIVPLLDAFKSVHEAAAVGTIFVDEGGIPRLHMHAALGRDGHTRTGCVRTGLDVWTICEVIILEILDSGMIRRLDTTTGFQVLSEE